MTDLILEVFKLNGRLLTAGDQLVSSLGLTSARWQVLGAIALSGVPQPVANIARNMGLTRQAVQRVVNELEAEGFLTFAPNPHHQRAKLVVLSKSGTKAFQAAAIRQAPWANQLARRISARDIRTALGVVREIVTRLEHTARDTNTQEVQ
ncbi:MAG: MarR family winged helix-turn-helix transcriptional regulator [Candidatus Korobacteraceae bacterium]